MRTVRMFALVCAMCTAGSVMAQTYPTPRSVPFTETFGTTGSATAPSGFTVLNGLSGASVGTQTAAEATVPASNGTIAITTPGSGAAGGAFSFAVGGDGRIAIAQSSNATNGVNQWLFAINTTGSSGLTLQYDILTVVSNSTYAGVVSQYRVGHAGAWTSLAAVTGNPYLTQGTTAGASTHVTIPLPAAVNNQSEVQIRFADWRVVVSGNSSVFGIDNVDVSVGSVDPAGSCCDNLGVCTDTTQSACSGTFNLAQLCSATTCTATAGACCNSQGVCALTTPSGCTGTNHYANGVACAAANCAQYVAACCNPADGTCFVTFPLSCTGANLSLSTGTSCTPANPCPQPTGACCAGAACTADVAANACTTGNWLGTGSTCSANICTPPQVVISQLYGGGGASASAASYQQDFVELFNRSATDIDISGWTLHYASSTGTSWSRSASIPAGTILASGKYFLIAFSQGAGPFNGTDLSPLADFAPSTGNLQMSATAGKVALSRTGSIIPNTACPIGQAIIVDFIGFGSADCFEGTAAVPTLSNTTAALRNLAGCTDTDQNASDFTVGTPAPRNGATPINVCGVVPQTGICCSSSGVCTTATPGNPAMCPSGQALTLNTTCGAGNTPCIQPQAGKCCQADGSCVVATPGDALGSNTATCASGTLTIGGTCSTNTCPQPPSGVCCRGATCSTAYTSAAACAAALDTVSPATIFSKFVSTSSACNTPVTVPGTLGNVTSPCCYANYNHNTTIEVQDIFDFLNDWFAGKKGAIVGGDGTTGTLSVQNIFDFLNAWFAGGCN